jgi:hypothetical protein
MPTPVRAPYLALGDSLTQGMQSMGLAWISQAYSYPKQIADFLGARPFNQPVLKGWLPEHAPPGVEHTWVGNPPNLELVLRRAEALLSAQPQGTVPDPNVWQQLHDEVEAIAAVLREAIADYVHTVEDAEPEQLLVEPPPSAGYQNLGVAGFSVLDVSTMSYARVAHGMRVSFRGQLARLARHALEGATEAVQHVTHGQPGLLHALSLALVTASGHDFGPRMQAERVRYVLGTGTSTALDAARAQQPQLVTLWIGSNDVITTMCDARIWDGDTPLYTLPDVFRKRLAALLDEILNFESHPYVFLATLPSPTASPNLVRDRLGHWKSMLPSAAFLLDAQLLELETVVQQYNAIIAELAANRAGRVWLVDMHAMQERLQRATRRESEVLHRVVTHAVRAGSLSPQGAHAALAAARAGNLETIRHALEIDARLAGRSFTELVRLSPQESGAYLASDALSALPDRTNVDTFTVRLATGKTYRLTGDYLAADDKGAILQGGAVSLDAIHLTNTAYAFAAREFLKVIYAADAETRGSVLRGLVGQQKGVAQFDAELLRVARDDSLLNSVPRLLPAALDAAGAAADLLGELHYSDPYLTR